uniref:non-specific serine/threonine protein kinase n=1 Tax=Arcella intermedia TaxID=1963864 RepID=A0A6B2L2U0_9EUKA
MKMKNLTKKKIDELNAEVEICGRLAGNSNIVQYKGKEIDQNEDKLYFFFELCIGGDLFSKIAGGPIKEHKAKIYFMDILNGISWMHQMGFVHRDLKPENCLIDEDDCVKLSDFGLAAQLEFSKSGEEKYLKDYCGTHHYAAPEVLRNKPYLGRPADIWSCGIILYSMVSGRLPFSHDDPGALTDLILQGQINYPAGFTRPIKDLIAQILVVDPEKRPPLEEIISHRWFPKRESTLTPPTSQIKRIRANSTKAPKSFISNAIEIEPSKDYQNPEARHDVLRASSPTLSPSTTKRKHELPKIEEKEPKAMGNKSASKKRRKKKSDPLRDSHKRFGNPPSANAFQILSWSGVFDISRILQNAVGPTNIKTRIKPQFISEMRIDKLMDAIYNHCVTLPEVEVKMDTQNCNIAISDGLDLDGHIQVHSLAPKLYLVDFVQEEGDKDKWFDLYRTCNKLCK